MRTRSLTLTLTLGMLLSVAGCDLLSSQEPEEARLLIDGPAGSQARLILSSNFLYQRIPLVDQTTGIVTGDTLLVDLLQADTVEVSLPFDGTFQIDRFDQFYARLNRLVDSTSTFEARLLIDGDEKAEQDLTLGQDSLVFVYNFRSNPLPRDPDEV
ncbi:MAG: hypothetical protein AAF970_04455 [Bacteroidota bacterium]